MKVALAVILLAILAVPAMAAADDPNHWDRMFSTHRLYPFAQVEQNWRFEPYGTDSGHLGFGLGCAYSLGIIAPSVTWNWFPQDGADSNELRVAVRLNLRALGK